MTNPIFTVSFTCPMICPHTVAAPDHDALKPDNPASEDYQAEADNLKAAIQQILLRLDELEASISRENRDKWELRHQFEQLHSKLSSRGKAGPKPSGVHPSGQRLLDEMLKG